MLRWYTVHTLSGYFCRSRIVSTLLSGSNTYLASRSLACEKEKTNEQTEGDLNRSTFAIFITVNHSTRHWPFLTTICSLRPALPTELPICSFVKQLVRAIFENGAAGSRTQVYETVDRVLYHVYVIFRFTNLVDRLARINTCLLCSFKLYRQPESLSIRSMKPRSDRQLSRGWTVT